MSRVRTRSQKMSAFLLTAFMESRPRPRVFACEASVDLFLLFVPESALSCTRAWNMATQGLFRLNSEEENADQQRYDACSSVWCASVPFRQHMVASWELWCSNCTTRKTGFVYSADERTGRSVIFFDNGVCSVLIPEQGGSVCPAYFKFGSKSSGNSFDFTHIHNTVTACASLDGFDVLFSQAGSALLHCLPLGDYDGTQQFVPALSFAKMPGTFWLPPFMRTGLDLDTL
jgi:hypothetical protein